MSGFSRRSMIKRGAGAAAAFGLTGGTGVAEAHSRGHGRHRHGRRPIVIGHRGAPAFRPEHTHGSYELAIELGADYIEPDLVFTKDGKLVVRHEPDIAGTTDVADKFPESRKTTHTIDGVTATSFYTFDFTLAEIKTLRAKERLPDIRPANTAFDGLFEIPTFQEVIDIAKAHDVGIYPETKHPTFFGTLGFSFDRPLLDTLSRNGLNRRGAKVFIQSFEVGNLKRLRGKTPLPLIQLIDVTGAPADFVAAGDPRTYDDLVTPAGLADIARYANGIGPDRSRILSGDVPGGTIGAPTNLVRDAHRVGLLLHPFTFRPENNFLATQFQQGNPASPQFPRARGDEPAQIERYFELGIDGMFCDNSDTAVAVRDRLFS